LTREFKGGIEGFLDAERFYDVIPEALIISDQEGKIVYVNQSAQDVLGYEEKELLGMSAGKLYADREKRDRLFKKLFEKGRVNNFELTLEKKDGTIIDTLASATISLDEGGEIQRAFGMFQDITERKRLEEELYVKDWAIESSVNGIALADLEGNISYVNRSFLEIWGYDDAEEVLGRRVNEFWRNPGKAEEIVKALEETGIWSGELEAEKKDGTFFHVRLSANMVKDGEGRPICMMGSFIDITEQKNMEERLRNREKEYQIIFDSVPAMIWYKDTDNNVIRVNKRAAEAMGRPVEEIEGKRVEELLPEEAQEYYQDDLEVIESGEPKRNIEEPLQTVSGETLWVRTDKVPFIDEEGNIIGLIVLSKDITEQRKMRKELIQAKRLAAIGRLASVVGHELRNPLGVINNSTYYLKAKLKDFDDPKVERHLQILDREVERSNNIISDLLDFARGPKEPNKRPAQLEKLVEDSLERVEIPENIHVETNIKAPTYLFLDPDMIFRVFINLIGNAIEAMPDGGTLGISVTMDKDEDEVVVEVSDTGVGISDEDKDKMFTPFFSTKAKGIGLGLHVTKELVEAHNGSITFDSTEGEGTVFTFTLPMEEE